VADRPIIFSAPMVRALLDGRKTQTRRVLKPQPERAVVEGEELPVGVLHAAGERLPRVTIGRVITRQEIRFAPGDRLWVREACALWMTRDGKLVLPPDEDGPVYRATEPEDNWRAMLSDQKTLREINCGKSCRTGNWAVRNSIFMPRWASRLTLIVESVKVERLQDISEADAWAEGIEALDGALDDKIRAIASSQSMMLEDARTTYAALWESINGPDSWAANPWVAAISFRVIRANIDRGGV